MKPLTFDRALPPCITAKQCWRCSAKRQHLAPSLEDVPAALRGINEAIAASLAPLEVDVGPEIRSRQSNGYRQHASMIRFAWHGGSVADCLAELPEEDFENAHEAFDWLMENNPLYNEFVTEHNEFLENYPEPTDKQRKRWLRIIERAGVECACWPHLFWQPELCFYVERLQDPRRVASRAKIPCLEQRIFGGDEADAYEAEDDPYAEDEGDDTVMHSVRRSFAAKAMGPLTDDGSNCEISHYIFDF